MSRATEVDRSFGELVAIQRTQMRLSQTEVGDAIGASQSRIWAIESGSSPATIAEAAALATALSTTIPNLLREAVTGGECARCKQLRRLLS